VRQVVEHLEREHEPRAGQRLLERLGWGQGYGWGQGKGQG